MNEANKRSDLLAQGSYLNVLMGCIHVLAFAYQPWDEYKAPCSWSLTINTLGSNKNESRSMYMVSKHPAIELHTPRKPFQVDIISSAISQQYAALVQKHQAWSMTFRCTEWRRFEGMEQGGKSQGPGCLESFWAWKQYLSLVRGGARCQKKILFKDEWTWEGLSK